MHEIYISRIEKNVVVKGKAMMKNCEFRMKNFLFWEVRSSRNDAESMAWWIKWMGCGWLHYEHNPPPCDAARAPTNSNTHSHTQHTHSLSLPFCIYPSQTNLPNQIFLFKLSTKQSHLSTYTKILPQPQFLLAWTLVIFFKKKLLNPILNPKYFDPTKSSDTLVNLSRKLLPLVALKSW